MWAFDSMRSPLFRQHLSPHSALPTPKSSSRLHLQNLRLFHGLRHSLTDSALSDPFRVNMTTLQGSLYGTDYGFALLSQEDTSLQHNQSPDCTGRLLRGSLAIITTGLTPVR